MGKGIFDPRLKAQLGRLQSGSGVFSDLRERVRILDLLVPDEPQVISEHGRP